MTIVEHLLNSAQQNAKLSPFNVLDSFFANDIKNQDENTWPLNTAESGYLPQYSRVQVVCDKSVLLF